MNATEQAAPMSASLLVQVATLQSALATERAALAESRALVEQLTEERDHLRTSHDRLRQELELLRRRIFIAKAERVDSRQLELEFAQKLSALDALSGQLAEQPLSKDTGTGASTDGASKPAGKQKPKGRRDLREANIPEVRVEICDPVFDKLVGEGKAERIGFEESYKLAWQRGGHRRLVIARAKYRVRGAQQEFTVATAPMPDETFPRSLAAPSMLAHIVAEKHLQGLPLYRLEDRYSREGAPIDRGTMCRWLENAGATAGSTVIEAAKKEALAKAFCLATDATGVAVQPIPREDKKRQPCRRAHFFDDHGTSAGHLFSLIASARLHRLDPEEYLRDLFRVLGHWPRDRYLELAPKYWAETRARLDPTELANEVGPLTIPPAPQEQSPSG